MIASNKTPPNVGSKAIPSTMNGPMALERLADRVAVIIPQIMITHAINSKSQLRIVNFDCVASTVSLSVTNRQPNRDLTNPRMTTVQKLMIKG